MVNIWAERDLVVKDFSTLRRSRADSAASAELCDDLCVIAEDGEGKVSVSSAVTAESAFSVCCYICR